MADSVNPQSLPGGFDLYGGYDDGAYNNVVAIKERFPDKTVLAFTVFASDDFGDCLDVESGDATPGEAPGWVQQRRAAGHKGPLVYMSESAWLQVRQAFQDQKVTEPGYIVAAYPGEGAIIPPGAVGHQWIDRGPYDESVMDDYLPGIDPAPPAPPKKDEEDMPLYITNSKGTGFVVATDLSSKRGVIDGEDAGALLATGLYERVAMTDAMLDTIPG